MSDERRQDSAPTEETGGSSHDRPGSAEASGGAGEAGRKHHEPARPDDTNERADERARIVEPDGDPAPRA